MEKYSTTLLASQVENQDSLTFALRGNRGAVDSKDPIEEESKDPGIEPVGRNRPNPGSNALMSKLIAVTPKDNARAVWLIMRAEVLYWIRWRRQSRIRLRERKRTPMRTWRANREEYFVL